MKKSVSKIAAKVLCIAMVFSLTIGNFTLADAEELMHEELVREENVVESMESQITDDTQATVLNDENENVSSDSEATFEIKDEEQDIEYEEEAEEEVEDVEEASPSCLNESESETIFEEIEDDNQATISETIYDEIIADVATESEVLGAVIDSATMSTASVNFGSTNLDNVTTPSEIDFGDYNFGFVPTNIRFPKINKKNNVLFGSLPNSNAGDIPTSYDSRNVNGANYVPAIRNQNPYGMCWAFSTIGMMEIAIKKKYGEEVDLSEAALGYYYFNLKSIYDNNHPEYMDLPGLEGKDYAEIQGDWREAGGNALKALLMMSAYVGAVEEDSETSYSVNTMNNIKQNGLNGMYAYHKNRYVLNNAKFYSSEDITIKGSDDMNAVKRAIMEYGSVGISYCELGDSALKKVGDDYYFKNKEPMFPNHAVTVVGWDDNIPKENFNFQPSEPGAWLVRNSWGTGSYLDSTNRKEGYFWMSYEEASLRAEDFYAADAISADTYKYNYHYDTTCSEGVSGVMHSVGNVFKVTGEEDQILEAVNIALYSNDEFTLKIYTKDSKMDHPEDGEMALEQQVYPDTAGIYTISLNTKVPLPLNTYYSIVAICGEGQNSHLSIWTDATGNSYDPYYVPSTTNDMGPGQSFTTEYNSWTHVYDWKDEYNDRKINYRIKGLANPSKGVGFDANGGQGSMSRLNGDVGNEEEIPENAFSREGYTFVKWNTKSDGSGTSYYSGDPIVIQESAITLYAQWSPIHYKLIFDPNGQTGVVASSSYAYDEIITLSNPGFSSEQKTFDGWQETSGEGTKKYAEDAEVSKLSSIEDATVTLYAHWIPGAFKVKFDGNGATDGVMDIQGITRDVDTPLNQNQFTRTGYLFSGWNTESNGSGTSYADKANVINLANKDEIYELFAQWTPITYTIKYNANGGTVLSQSVNKTYASNVTLATTSKIGYEFGGWYTDNNSFLSEYGGTTDICTTNNGTVNIYAKWIENNYNIILEENGGTYVSPYVEPTSRKYTERVVLPTADNIKKDGYTFDGWYETNDFQGSKVTQILANTDENKTYYLKWTENTYHIFYQLRGGHLADGFSITPYTSRLYTESKTLPISDNITRLRFSFAGWNNKKDLSGSIITEVSANTAEDTYAYATWDAVSPYALIEFKTNGGSDVFEQAVMPGEEIVEKPSNPTKSGYTFAGWYIDNGTFTNEYDFSAEVTGPVVLYARWNQNATPAPPIGRRSGGSSSGGGGNGNANVGPLSQSINASKAMDQSNAKTTVSRTTDHVVSLDKISWQYDAIRGTWSLNVDKDTGAKAANGFFAIPSLDANGNQVNDIYNFDADGNMVTGWVKDESGNMYFFNVTQDVNIGKMAMGWKEIGQGLWYYFNEDGKMMTNGFTPDGSYVRSDGKWVDGNSLANIYK